MRLSVVIKPDGDGFHAKMPALPGCGTWGKTETEARKLIKEAIQLYLKPDRMNMKNSHRKAKHVRMIV